VNIRFTSSLTHDDEHMVAPALLKALSAILDLLPIAYSLRIETSDASVYQHTGKADLRADTSSLDAAYNAHAGLQ
jgi:hypothetical protein